LEPGEISLDFKADNPVEVARRVTTVGHACLLREDFVEAQCWFLFALALHEAEESNKNELGKLANTIARMWHQSGRLQEATSVLRS
jgi:hypothetical protein